MSNFEVAVAISPDDLLTGEPPARNAHGLAALMRQAGVAEQVMTATAGWLSSERRKSAHTQDGYVTDLSRWVGWCIGRGKNPVAAPATEADLFAAGMRDAGLADTTRARRLSAASSWLRYLFRVGAAETNPFDHMERPRVSGDSDTKGMSEDELNRFLACAQQRESPRTYAVLAVMAATACRVSSVTRAQRSGLGDDRGHRIIDMPVKGGKDKRFVLPAVTLTAIEGWLAVRGDEAGFLFTTSAGKPLDQPSVFRTVRRVARLAAIPQADELSPHSIRHSVLTVLFDHGYPLHVIQDLAGHADTRTTRRYDLGRESLDRSPANDLGAIYAAGISRYASRFGASQPVHPATEEAP